MTYSSKATRNIAVFLAVLSLSAVTMIWLFWHHPVKTLVATVAVLAALGMCARLARSIEVDSPAELERGEPSV
jgi:4-hydroxybenzoate polyprenyltransferase